MRCHVGKHILKNDNNLTAKTCGFCGRNGCHIDIVVSSGRGAKANLGVLSKDCKSYYKFSLGSAEPKFKKDNDGEFQLDSKGEKILKITKTAPCSNRPICCKLCKNMVIWSYNMSIHYAQTHPGIELPEFINKDEIKYVKNFKV